MTSSRTKAAQAGIKGESVDNAVVAPISVSSAYVRADPGAPGAFDYARTGAPGRAELERALADLEGAAGAVAVSSGMAAIDLVLNLVPNQARVVCAHDCYGGTRRLMDARAAQRGFDLVYADASDAAALEAAIGDAADLVFLESPSNPRLRITDIQAACASARRAGALSVVDNTVLSAVQQKPLALGADLTVSSITKILNGHSDMVGGVACAADPAHVDQLAWWANAAGATSGAFDVFLALRGLRTLPLRARAQSETALILAERLTADRRVARVDYPGLTSHPGHGVACDQQDGFGCLLSLELKSGLAGARAFVSDFDVFTLAQSLGGAESLAAIPATMTHAAMSAEARAAAGVADGLVRLSVGLEDPDDLWADLQTALQRSESGR
mgnify:FL=1